MRSSPQIPSHYRASRSRRLPHRPSFLPASVILLHIGCARRYDRCGDHGDQGPHVHISSPHLCSAHASQNKSTNGTSTGNSAHTQPFKFRVVHDDYFTVKTGLSAYKDKPDEATRSLLPLLHHAKTCVPSALHASTPVMLRANAGLRMLGNASAEAILDAMRETLRASGFRFDADDWASVLSGTEEAVYTWMTVNSLLGRDAQHTVGTLQLGGGSTHIAFVPDDNGNNMNHTATDGARDFDARLMSYGGHDLRLYAASHMDYGLQKARIKLLSLFKSNGRTHENPCFNAVGTNSERHNLSVRIPFANPPTNVTVSGSGTYEACQTLIRKALVDGDVGKRRANARNAPITALFNQMQSKNLWRWRSTVSVRRPSVCETS